MDYVVPLVIGASTVAGAFVIYPATIFALDISPYLYANTRCSARSGLILNKQNYDSLMSAASQKEVLAELEDSYYKYIIEHAATFSGFSQMLEKDLYDNYLWLHKIVPDKVKPMLNALKMKFEINEIKTIINKIKEGKEPGEPHFIQDDVLKLKLESVKDFSSFLTVMESSQYAAVFSNAKLENLTPLNNALDKFYFDNVLNEIGKCKDSKAAQPFRDYWTANIDLINLKLILRKISSGEDVVLLDGGSLNKNELQGVSDLAQLDSILSSSDYHEFIEKPEPFAIESGMYKYLRQVGFNSGAKYTIKAGSIVKFIVLKELEVRNLNIINKLKLEDYPSEEIEKLVVV